MLICHDCDIAIPRTAHLFHIGDGRIVCQACSKEHTYATPIQDRFEAEELKRAGHVGKQTGQSARARPIESPETIVKVYKGTQKETAKAFTRDAENMAGQGYAPTSQVWAPGSYGCGSFVVALILCVVLVGIFIFIYMLVVPPPGVLTVTYAKRQKEPTQVASLGPSKTCPMCAELVKKAALVCRFCGHRFDR